MVALAAAATGCEKSGIDDPSKATLAVDPANPDTVALIVKPGCAETEIKIVPADNPDESRIVASNMSLYAVESYPAVDSLYLLDNAISSFKSSGTTVKEIDLTNNHITSLDAIKLPSGLQRLILDFNVIPSFSASDFPDTLQQLYFRKSSLAILSAYEFPGRLQELYITGNQGLGSLEGLELPAALKALDCSDCGVEEIVGVVFPKSMQKFTVTGKPITSFIVRESDVKTLQSMQLQMDMAGDTPSCDGGTITDIQTFSACVYDDATFASKYPAVPRTTTRAPSPSDSDGSSAPTTPSPTPTDANQNGDSGGGSNSTTILVGIIVAIVVVAGIIIACLMRRRRRRSPSMDAGVSSKATATYSKLEYTAEGTNSSGFLTNDVRNDVELIPYRLPHDELEISSKLATGGFGVVYLAKLYGQSVVVKQVAPNKANSVDILRRFMDEIRLYARLSHPKVVRFVGLSWTNLLDLGLVMEYMPNGDLHSILKANRKIPQGRRLFTWFGTESEPRSKAAIALDVAEALVYLHSFASPIIHRDLKAKNVLMSSDYEAKLSDFGISRESAEETMTAGMGTTAWIAPEVLQGERYTETADIYSFGILMCELDTCGHPYNHNKTGTESLTDAKIAYLVSTASLQPVLAQDCPESIAELILDCIQFDPTNRPSALELHYNLRKAQHTTLDRDSALV